MSKESEYDSYIIFLGSEPPSRVGIFPTSTHWLNRCSNGCNTCMNCLLKKDKSVSIKIMFGLIKSFEDAIKDDTLLSWERQFLVMSQAYVVIFFGAYFQGSEGLKLDMYSTKRHFAKREKS